ncbi:cupin domain-containing protein [Aquiflexum gelatinilyticum]|uniref:Cupin domain-containing protein n=1 Tax=Aquiflexum gelatinilyticum TaxID=2961943 RepID=A0A9X2P5U7_9BACT|nr:cupin domain-containing protein [Aquiflexum gelatinilyticum]MCR9014220.1 cupin domain-containing protein [Aquiflexum gelatinilyticum]
MTITPFQIENELPWEEADQGIQRKMYGHDEQVMMVKVKFEAGAVGKLHSHPHSQVTYVESGVFDMTIGTETKRIKTGEGYYVKPHVMHRVVCIEPGVLIDVFSPFREDFFGTK